MRDRTRVLRGSDGQERVNSEGFLLILEEKYVLFWGIYVHVCEVCARVCVCIY